MNEAGHIYPGDTKTCPQPCWDSLTESLITDASGNIVFDWGNGCPKRCPATTDGNGVVVSTASDSSSLGTGSWWFPPIFACPLACLDSEGNALRRNSSESQNATVVTILPLAEKYDEATDKMMYKAVTGADEQLRSMMCPIKCPDADYFLQPQWVQDPDGFWSQAMVMSETDCPIQCADGTLAWPAYHGACDGTVAMSATNNGNPAGFDFF